MAFVCIMPNVNGRLLTAISNLVVFVNSIIDMLHDANYFVCPFLPAANEAAGSNGSVVSFCSQGGPMWPLPMMYLISAHRDPAPYTGPERPPPSPHTQCPPPCTGPWTCSNLFKLELTAQEPPSPNIIHFEAHIVGKWAVGILLESFLVDTVNLYHGLEL